jgi:hypothetical protein
VPLIERLWECLCAYYERIKHMKLSSLLAMTTLVCSAATFAGSATASVEPFVKSGNISPIYNAEQATTSKAIQFARSRPRVPGGSGCDDAHDIAEHPECRVGGVKVKGDKTYKYKDDSGRKRKRVPGGSGCDSAHDIAEHAECRS